MSVLPIRVIPDPVLRTLAARVTSFDRALATLVERMQETMYKAPGIGLAAPQVGVSQRVFVMDTSEDCSGFRAFVNPNIRSRSGKELSEEGCLSIPDFRETIQRFKKVTVQAFDVRGEEFEVELAELDAFCVQHELDHLNGVLFTDHLSRLKKPIFTDWLSEQGIEKP